ncbi:hypothetical protein [Conchiformibius kuhniae]|uniref:Uncharacterized protein n=1 Tax=Conchiformibius kuhniae TaxID=211502 RepID=A0A8T9MU42_9NEIS|nr:hypothetical protein [Conchiformibius kuhniae]UOP04614.1 hypothetical protein LVJ77_10330 [Conchiformibius kuhniae]
MHKAVYLCIAVFAIALGTLFNYGLLVDDDDGGSRSHGGGGAFIGGGFGGGHK